MDSLAHWDFTVQFSGYQAAALILGIDPGKPESPSSDQSPIKAVYERLALHYDHALKRHYHEAFNIQAEDFLEVEANLPFELQSVTLNKLRHLWDLDQDKDCPQEEHEFTEWLLSNQSHDFGAQTFSREDIAHWLGANDLNSVYSFNLSERRPEATASGH